MLVVAGCSSQPELRVYELHGTTMGTEYIVKVVDGPDTNLPPDIQQRLTNLVQPTLDAVDRRMSTYKPDSELSQLNNHKTGAPFEVSEELFAVLQKAREISERSGGAFDVTVGPLVNAWGFGPDGRPKQIPTDDELAALRERVGYSKLLLNNKTAQKQHPNLYCDLSAIAKGYAVDRVADALEALGCMDYMVDVGGEVRAKGLNDRDVPWRIAIEKPDPARMGGVFRVVGLRDAGMATSGDYRNFFEMDGVRYSHTIDPRTGRPVTHGLTLASVIHEECATADALATTLMVLGPEAGYAFAEEHGLAAFMLVRDEGEELEVLVTPQYEAYLLDAPDE